MSVLDTIYLREGLGKAATTKTGPNDVKRVVWAIRKFFFPFFCILISLMTVFRYYYLREGGDHENGPKRRQTRRLGHW
jgi:hypothetical protein